MKNIFYILLLLPTIIFAQYPSNSGHKITLGEQTTADGLIFRGVASDTTLTAKSDTAAYFVLDTVNLNLYTYKISASGRKWRQLGADTAAIAYVNTYDNQTVNGAKTFTSAVTATRFNPTANTATGTGMFLPVSNTLGFSTNGTERLRLTSTALGLGVTPKNLSTDLPTFQAGNATFAGSASSNVAYVGTNYYYDQAAGVNKFIGSGYSTRFQTDNGNYYFLTSNASGTADATVSFTQAMTLGINSGLSIGTASAAPANGLLVAGAATFSSSVAANSFSTTANINGDPEGFTLTNTSTGSSAESTLYVRNESSNLASIFFSTSGTNNTAIGGFLPDQGTIGTGTLLSNGMALMVRAAADMRFYTSGHTNERMRIKADGKVGIGTATPQSLLQISNSANFSAVLKVSDLSTESTGAIVLGDGGSTLKNVGIWRAAANSMTTYGNSLNLGSYSDMVFTTGATELGSQAERMRILATNGNVGIGTASPATNLQVNTSSGSATVAISNGNSITAGSRGDYAWYNSSISTVALIRAAATTDNVGTGLEFHTRPVGGALTKVLDLASTGAATFSGSVAANSLSLTTPLAVANGGTNTSTAFTAGSVVFAGSSGTYTQDNSNLFFDNGNNRLGVATNTPTQKLHVVGNAYITSKIAVGLDPSGIGGAVLGLQTTNNNTEYFRGYNATGSTRFGWDLVSDEAVLTLFGNNDVKMRTNGDSYLNGGKVGIGTASPLALLNVMGTVRINSASAPDANYYLQLENSSSQKAKANAWDTYSDSRIKTNRQPIINAIDKINLLNPTYYNQHDSYVEDDLLNIDYNNSYKSLGFIAQEVYEVIPEAVNMGTTNELWAMDYTKLIPILTKAIQEQQAQIEALKQRLLILENK